MLSLAPPPGPRSLVPRRTLLGALTAATGITLSACEAPSFRVPGSGTEQQSTATAPSRDAAALQRSTASTLALTDLLTRTLVAHPSLSLALTPLSTVHADHLAALTDLDDSPGPPSPETPAPPPPPVAAVPARAVSDVLAAEQAHADALVQDAEGASSGPFARLLAVMAAGVHQGMWTLTRSEESA